MDGFLHLIWPTNAHSVVGASQLCAGDRAVGVLVASILWAIL